MKMTQNKYNKYNVTYLKNIVYSFWQNDDIILLDIVHESISLRMNPLKYIKIFVGVILIL